MKHDKENLTCICKECNKNRREYIKWVFKDGPPTYPLNQPERLKRSDEEIQSESPNNANT